MTAHQFPPVVPVTRWVDPLVDRIGFDILDPYVEIAWLPVIGPSATWMLRRLHSWLPDDSTRIEVDLSELGLLLGLGHGVTPCSSVQRTMDRLVRFGLAEWSGVLRVRGSVPPLSDRQLARQPAWVREAHAVMVAGRAA